MDKTEPGFHAFRVSSHVEAVNESVECEADKNLQGGLTQEYYNATIGRCFSSA